MLSEKIDAEIRAGLLVLKSYFGTNISRNAFNQQGKDSTRKFLNSVLYLG
jgi:hypothetical protein